MMSPLQKILLFLLVPAFSVLYAQEAVSETPPPEPSQPAFGQIDVNPTLDGANGGAESLVIQIDGYTGYNDQPFKIGLFNVVAGRHTVVLSHPCYEPVTHDIDVGSGQTVKLDQPLVRAKGKLSLRVVYDNIERAVPVWIDGQQVGVSPYQGEVPFCSKVEVGDEAFKNEVPVELKLNESVEVVHQLIMNESVAVPQQPADTNEVAASQLDTATASLDTNTAVQLPLDTNALVDQLPDTTVAQQQPADTANKFVKAEAELDWETAEMSAAAGKTAEPKQQETLKRLWGGLFVGATYNDFYDTKFGLSNLRSTDDYVLRVEGADGLLGNYWGVGANAGIGALFFMSPYFALNTGVAASYRRGSGESDVTVKLYWFDDRQPEKSDLNIEYKEAQLNIDVPLTLRFMVPEVVYLEAGPMASFNVYSKNESTVTDIYGSESYSESGGLEIFEFDLVFGLGSLRHVGLGMLDINVRFVLGMTPLNKADDAPKTWQGQLNIGYWFL